MNCSGRKEKKRIFTVASDNLVANEAQVSEQLVVVSLAIGQSFLFVMAVTQERLLAFGTHKVLKQITPNNTHQMNY